MTEQEPRDPAGFVVARSEAEQDPFGTAAVRRRVVAGWVAAPVRLREDANAEEDLALGGYRDRLVVELAQNAADAAVRGGTAGRLLLTLSDTSQGPVLVAANVGAPLDAAGVQSLATLRASAKTAHGPAGPDSPAGVDRAGDLGPPDDLVGRFGVGFAAVLAVTDQPSVLSRSGGVRFSRPETADLLASLGDTDLDAEVRRRGGQVPALRLPFAVRPGSTTSPPDGYDTAVVLPLRDAAAARLVRSQLTGIGDPLLLALPGLAEIVVQVDDGAPQVFRGVDERWWVHRRSGVWTAQEAQDLLADRPTEERRRRGWQVLWAIPRSPGTPVPAVVQAPTPTDEPQSLPALLLATLPLDPTRRHVAGGLLADRILTECAHGYAELLVERAAAGVDVLPYVPVGLAAGALDAAVREQVLALLPDLPLLVPVDGGDLLRPAEAVRLDVDAGPGPSAALADRLAGLVAVSRSRRAALTALGVRETTLSDVVDSWPTDATPARWHELYTGLAPLADDPAARESLAALPVPLADGRTVRGARGALAPDPDGPDPRALVPLGQFGLRLIHPDAVHPLLGRLGAVPASARALLDGPVVRAAVAASPEVDDPHELAAAVLEVVTGAGLGALPSEVDRSWLADLELPDSDGGLGPAGALALPGSVAAGLLDRAEVGLLADDWVARWPRQTLVAVGVLDDLGLVVGTHVDLLDPPVGLVGLDGFEVWARTLVDAGVSEVAELSAVRDLDVVRPERLPDAVRHLAARPLLRRALVEPVRTRRLGDLPSYSAWWLQRELALAGTAWPAPTSDNASDASDEVGAYDGLLDPAPAWVGDLDPVVRAALGVLDPEPGARISRRAAEVLLVRLADPRRRVDAVTCLRAWRRLLESGAGVEFSGWTGPGAPQQVRVLDGDGTRVVRPAEAVVVDDPRWLQRTDLGGQVVAPAGRAHHLVGLLDIDFASERAAGAVRSTGTRAPVPAAVRRLLPTAPAGWVEHEVLVVDEQEVDWWVDQSGVPHAATTDGLARALAWAAGRWSARQAVAEVLVDPADVVRVMVETGWE